MELPAATLKSATCYADRAWFGSVTIQGNVQVARDTFRLTIAAPTIAERILPGQFVMLRIARQCDPLLGRALALYDVTRDPANEPAGLEVVYLVTGKMTRRLSGLAPGEELEAWGPLGNGFPPVEARHLVMVAGGIGMTPFLAVARQAVGRQVYGVGAPPVHRPERISFCYGVRSREYLAAVEEFQDLGVDVRISTDDGSAGYHGRVSELARLVIQESPQDCRIVCCGPERMMAAVARLAHELQVPCQVSLETPMACGIGICFTCVAKVRQPDEGWDYRRTCVEGPVFDAAQLVWDD